MLTCCDGTCEHALLLASSSALWGGGTLRYAICRKEQLQCLHLMWLGKKAGLHVMFGSHTSMSYSVTCTPGPSHKCTGACSRAACI